MIPGLNIAIGTMKTSEQSEFIFSPEYAFGSHGCPPRIPTDAYVFFRIELINCIDSSDPKAYGNPSKNLASKTGGRAGKTGGRAGKTCGRAGKTGSRAGKTGGRAG